ncbi:MAG: hypothetical protein AAF264_11210 [Pseudomonadota bacterium]
MAVALIAVAVALERAVTLAASWGQEEILISRHHVRSARSSQAAMMGPSVYTRGSGGGPFAPSVTSVLVRIAESDGPIDATGSVRCGWPFRTLVGEIGRTVIAPERPPQDIFVKITAWRSQWRGIIANWILYTAALLIAVWCWRGREIIRAARADRRSKRFFNCRNCGHPLQLGDAGELWCSECGRGRS